MSDNSSSEDVPTEELQQRDEELTSPVGDHCPDNNFGQGGDELLN